MRVGPGVPNQTLVRVGHQQPHDRERDEVEERDAPEDLLAGGGQRAARVGRLGRGEADELRAAEGEGRRHEDGAEAFEAVVEGAGIVPVFHANVGAAGAAAYVEDYAEEAIEIGLGYGYPKALPRRKRGAGRRRKSQKYSHEPHNRNDLNQRKDELRLRIASHPEEIDDDNGEEEDDDPDGVGGRVPPEADGDARGHDLERQHDQPLDGVVPPHREAPCRVEEARRVGGEGARDGEGDGHLAQRLHGRVQHEADEREGDDERGGAAVHQGLAGADEEAGACFKFMSMSSKDGVGGGLFVWV